MPWSKLDWRVAGLVDAFYDNLVNGDHDVVQEPDLMRAVSIQQYMCRYEEDSAYTH